MIISAGANLVNFLTFRAVLVTFQAPSFVSAQFVTQDERP